MKDIIQSADWKKEKHVPVIELKSNVAKGASIDVIVSVGKEIAHPNTTEHHIAWINVYFLPKDEKFAYQIIKIDFASHGSSAQGPNTSTIFTSPVVNFSFKTEKSGTIIAESYCNIHGVWESSLDVNV
ncbi:MAG: class II SORL domain-containing protein [Candidatus Omnitrophica bacterium]|nr:class II SORL domain-containing protein [Candidatus Omnitrophota bacterium]